MAISKKSIIFVQSLWNLVKIITPWDNHFHEDWTKIEDFLVMVDFQVCLFFFYSDFSIFLFQTDISVLFLLVAVAWFLQLKTELSTRKATCFALGTWSCWSKTLHLQPDIGHVTSCNVDNSPIPLKWNNISGQLTDINLWKILLEKSFENFVEKKLNQN